MALFVGGFLIFNSFNMTVLQRMREIGMQRTLGATRPMIVRSVLRRGRRAWGWSARRSGSGWACCWRSGSAR